METWENERQTELNNWLQTESDPSLDKFKPGTYGCHELLDRISVVNSMIERLITRHPTCLQNAEWYALARQAAGSLQELSQKVGQVHLEGEGS